MGSSREPTALTMFERHRATRLISRDNAALNVLFEIPDGEEEAWVRSLLDGSV